MDFNKYRETSHLLPIALESKARYLLDVHNIDRSLTGRIEGWTLNVFIMEASVLIINSMTLLERGYFDNAFYSLRQSLESLTTMLYLIELGDEQREEALRKWKSEEKFPMSGQMERHLNAHSGNIQQVRESFQGFFDGLEATKKKLNKYTHKQGFDKFYLYHSIQRPSPDNRKDSVKADYEVALNRCISACATMRLAIDPLPILLADPEIYNRTSEMMTDAYSDDFVDRYFDAEEIDTFKKSEYYLEAYDYFKQSELQSEAFSSLLKYQLISVASIPEIKKQIHLLSIDDKFSIKVVEMSSQVTAVYVDGGFLWYLTDRESDRKSSSFDTRDYVSLCKDTDWNNAYGEAFLSLFSFGSRKYYIQHNGGLSKAMIHKIKKIGNELCTE